MRKAEFLVLAFCVFIASLPQDVVAARAPNAVECSINFEGAASREFAALLGLDSRHSTLELQLSEGSAWAVYLLKQDTIKPLSNMDGQPIRRNKFQFFEERPSHLKIGPYFQDLGTALPYSKPGYYTFTSDNEEESLNSSSPVSRLLKKWKGMKGWKTATQKSSGDEIFRRSFLSSDGTEATIQVYSLQTYPNNVPAWVYYLSFTFRVGDNSACRP